MKKALFLIILVVSNFQFLIAQAPVLGSYPSTTIMAASGNTVITPSTAPTNVTSATASTTANFKGKLHVNTVTGVVTVTNAHPAGNYTINVKAFNGTLTSTTNLLLTVNNTACSQGLFTSIINMPFPARPIGAVAIADFNSDGVQDMILTLAATNGNAQAATCFGDGAGNFTIVGYNDLGTSPLSIAAADFNGDGNQDFAVVKYVLNGGVSIFLGDGMGNFTQVADVPVQNSPISVIIADFNNDGKADFATANLSSNSISVRLGNGAGGFSGGADVPIPGDFPSVTAVGIGDFNGDGNQDFAAVNQNFNTVYIRLGNGAGGFSGTNSVVVGTRPQSIAIGDFNNDGKADLATGNYTSTFGTVSIRLGNGFGGFTGTTEVSVGNGPRAVVMGDFNGDGNQDFAAANYLNNIVSVRLGNGAGAFTAIADVPVGPGPQSIAIGDFNGDGRQDFVTPNYTNNDVSIRLGSVNEINVQGNNTDITDGNISPTTANHTDFGNVSNSLIRTFTIQNGGTGNLTVNSISINAPDTTLFTRGGITLPAIIAPGASATFTITFQPKNTGLATATVNINNNDCDEAVYDFVIQGTGIAVVPIIGSYPATTIATAGENKSVAPSGFPTNTAMLLAYTSAGFKGLLHVDTSTGILTITNAHPAGTYQITVKAIYGFSTTSTSLALTVNNTNCSAGLFSVPIGVNVGDSPRSIAIGDFNSDGKQDLVVANLSSNTISVSLGNNSSSFGTAININVGNQPISVAIGDFNGDGKQDLTVIYLNSFPITLLLGNGAGGFSVSSNIPFTNNHSTHIVKDFNGDGKPDIALANQFQNNISILLGNGAGSFTLYNNVSVGTNPQSIAAADFNTDGKTDLAVANYGSDNISILMGDGNGGFSALTNVPAGTNPINVATDDFNGDNKPDLIVANYGSNDFSVRLGDGSGSFTGTNNIPTGGYNPRSIATGDFNGDGKIDFVLTHVDSYRIVIRLGDGTGNFSMGEDITGVLSYSLAVGDFNTDGKQDIAVANYVQSSVFVYRGTDKEIDVKGNNTSIPDGDSVPAIADFTNFETVATGSNGTRIFNIQNVGTGSLTINNIYFTGTDSLLFTRSGITMPTTIAAGTSKTFSIIFTPTGNGIKTARVNIANNDCDESIYDFAIRGTAACTPSSSNNVWLGTTADWNLASNWSLDFVPSECNKVIVNAGVPFMPEISSPNNTCYSLTLNNGATVTIKTGGHLNITANN